MESINCANCGAPLQTVHQTQCSYCLSVFEPTMNKIDDMVFRSNNLPYSCVSYSTAAIYDDYPRTYVLNTNPFRRFSRKM